jgi:hypothetical protein
MRTIKSVNKSGDKTKQVFNDDGQLVEERTYFKTFGPFATKFTEKFTYDSFGLRVATTCWERGKLLWTKKHFYNSAKQLVKDVHIDDEGEGYVEYEYIENGEKILAKGQLADGHRYAKAWEVDSKGNKIPESEIRHTLK